jgi:hypothetical protein
MTSWPCGSASFSKSASGAPHSGHKPGQSSRQTGEKGSCMPTASMIGCSRSTVSSTTRPTSSSSSVVASVALSG